MPACDRLLTGGDIVDGTGAAHYPGGIAIRGDRIVAVGDLAGWEARETIDVAGLTLCPGFIDSHTHDDKALLADRAMTAKVSQGVTTVIAGNCGMSLAPLTLAEPAPSPLSEIGRPGDFRYPRFADYLDELRAAPAAVNAACLVGHSTLRVACMSRLDRPATDDELAAMRGLCAEAMEAGAIGLSSGLFYPTARAAPPGEVASLAAIAAAHGGIYCAHIRDEAEHVAEALDEAFAIAAEAGIKLVVSHHKVMGKANFGRSRETLAQIARARARQPVAFDVYPYTAGSTMLNRDFWASSSRVLVTWSDPHPEAAGRDLAEIAAEMGLSEEAAIAALSPGGGIFFMMDEADVRRILADPHAMIGSDGLPLGERPHPRLWGTFTRVLGRYAREEGLFGFEEAVRRMTGLTAREFRLAGRGLLAPGCFADVVALDRETVADRATFEDSTLPSAGIARVMVNGVDVLVDGQATGATPGRVLARAG